MKFKDKIQNSKLIAVDTETWGNIKKVNVWHPSIRMAYLSYANDKKADCLAATAPEEGFTKVSEFEVRYLANPNFCKVFWNAAFDIPVLKKAGLTIRGPILDAMLIAQTVLPHEPSHSLKHFSRKYLDDLFEEEDSVKKYVRKNKCEYGDVPYPIIAPYAIKDAKNTLELCSLLLDIVDDLDMWESVALEHRLLPVVLKMCQTGIQIGVERAQKLAADIRAYNLALKYHIQREVGDLSFNPNSSPQIAKVLWRDREAPRYTDAGNPSTDNLSLLLHGSGLARNIARYRKQSKALSTYFKVFDARTNDDGRLRCNLNQGAAVTGRFSSSGPNLQNQPRRSKSPLGRIRDVYEAPEGSRLVFIDYEQIEMRLLASLSNEEELLDAIRQGKDLHTRTCNRLFDKFEGAEDFSKFRYLAKRLNFAVVYGTGAKKFSDTILEDTGGKLRITRTEAGRYIKKWWVLHPAVKRFNSELLDEIATTGGIRTAYGYYINVPHKAYVGLNYCIQGTAAGVMKRALIKCSDYIKREGLATKMLLTVHDEIIFEIPRGERAAIPQLVQCMEERDRFAVPLTCSVEVGKTWWAKRPYPLLPS